MVTLDDVIKEFDMLEDVKAKLQEALAALESVEAAPAPAPVADPTAAADAACVAAVRAALEARDAAVAPAPQAPAE